MGSKTRTWVCLAHRREKRKKIEDPGTGRKTGKSTHPAIGTMIKTSKGGEKCVARGGGPQTKEGA